MRHETAQEGDGGRRCWRTECLILLVVIVVLLVLCINSYVCVFEDAFISFRYARNLVDGHGLVFNPGQPVWGYSNLLWTLLLAGSLAVGVPLLLASKLLGIACLVALLVLVLRWSRRYRSLALRWLGPLLLATSPTMIIAAQNGMETMLDTLLVAATALLLARAVAQQQAWPWYVLPALLASLTRPEGPLLLVAAMVVEVVAYGVRRDRQVLRRLVIAVACFAPAFLLYLLVMSRYYGAIVPNSFHVKVDTDLLGAAASGGRYLWLFLTESLGVLVFLPSLLCLARVRRWRHEAALLVCLAAGLLFVLVAGGDQAIYCHRFVVPMIPLLAMLTVAGLAVLDRRLQRRLPAARRIVLPVIVAGLVVVNALVARSPLETVLAEAAGQPVSGPGSLLLDDLVSLARFPGAFAQRVRAWVHDRNANLHAGAIGPLLAQMIEPTAVVATCQCGQIPFSLHQNQVVDLCGLMDDTIARHGLGPDTRDYLWSRDIDSFVLFANQQEGRYHAPETLFPGLVGSPRFRAHYALHHVFRYVNRLDSRGLAVAVELLVFKRTDGNGQPTSRSLQEQVRACIAAGRYTEIENRLDWLGRGSTVVRDGATSATGVRSGPARSAPGSA